MARSGYTFFVPDHPVPKGRARVNTKTGTAYTPTRTLQSEWRIRQHVSEVMAAGCETPLPSLDGPLHLSLIVALTPPAMPKKYVGVRLPCKRPDIDNYIKTVLDALNNIAFQDDSQVVSIHAKKEYAWNGNPGWYIGIRPANPVLDSGE